MHCYKNTGFIISIEFCSRSKSLTSPFKSDETFTAICVSKKNIQILLKLKWRGIGFLQGSTMFTHKSHFFTQTEIEN